MFYKKLCIDNILQYLLDIEISLVDLRGDGSVGQRRVHEVGGRGSK